MPTLVGVDLEMTVLIELHSIPNRKNQLFLQKIAKVTNGFRRQCRTIFQTAEWIAWRAQRAAQIEIDVEIEIPIAISRADNTAVMERLNFYGDDLPVQARMIATVGDIFSEQRAGAFTNQSRFEMQRLHDMFRAAPDSDDPHSLPSNMTRVACHILSSLQASDLVHNEVYGQVLDYVFMSYYCPRNTLAWRILYVNVLTNILCQFSKGGILQRVPPRRHSNDRTHSAMFYLHHQLEHIFPVSPTAFPAAYEQEVLGAVCTLFPKITKTLRVCMRMINGNAACHLSDYYFVTLLQRTYVELLTHVGASMHTLHTAITIPIPRIYRDLDSLEKEAQIIIQAHCADVVASNDKLVNDQRTFIRNLSEFRQRTHIVSDA